VTKFGYKISSEEHGPQELVDYARRAEQAGFGFAAISDHFHPWVTAQGHSSFVWAALGGIAQATDRIDIVTGVTCPTVRIHPAVVAHAAATAGVMLEGRFALGGGLRREPKRAHTRRPLARGPRAPGDARGGGRGHQDALGRRPERATMAATIR